MSELKKANADWGDFVRSRVNLTAYIQRFEPVDAKQGRAGHAVSHASSSGNCLSITDDQWNCFHCEQGGSVIDYEMSRLRTDDFAEACCSIADIKGLTLPEGAELTPEQREAAKQARARKATVAARCRSE